MQNQHGIADKTTYTWHQTSSNAEIEYSAAEWPVLPIEDIANALANTCRYNGHSSRFFSVAEHSIIISHLVPADLALAALLHDASEAYVGDVPTGLKRFLGISLKELENKAHHAIARGYDVTVEQMEHPIIKDFDKKILGDEARALMPPHRFWDQFPDRLDIDIKCLPPDEAKTAFLQRFSELNR